MFYAVLAIFQPWNGGVEKEMCMHLMVSDSKYCNFIRLKAVLFCESDWLIEMYCFISKYCNIHSFGDVTYLPIMTKMKIGPSVFYIWLTAENGLKCCRYVVTPSSINQLIIHINHDWLTFQNLSKIYQKFFNLWRYVCYIKSLNLNSNLSFYNVKRVHVRV